MQGFPTWQILGNATPNFTDSYSLQRETALFCSATFLGHCVLQEKDEGMGWVYILLYQLMWTSQMHSFCCFPGQARRWRHTESRGELTFCSELRGEKLSLSQISAKRFPWYAYWIIWAWLRFEWNVQSKCNPSQPDYSELVSDICSALTFKLQFSVCLGRTMETGSEGGSNGRRGAIMKRIDAYCRAFPAESKGKLKWRSWLHD